MCILFATTGKLANINGYRLILASNRDEFYSRKTAVCKWRKISSSLGSDANFSITDKENSDLAVMAIGGIDLHEGKEGGTWLSMSKNGKLAALLNVFQGNRKVEDSSCSTGGRGFLVTNFLSFDDGAQEYMLELESRSKKDADLRHYCNQSENPPVRLKTDVVALGNNLPGKAWQKVNAGKNAFEKILEDQLPKELLMEKLFEILSNDERHFPDPELQNQGAGVEEKIVESLASVFVKIKAIGYGTRTQTVIMVDMNNRVKFVERTINCSKPFTSISDAETETLEFEFDIISEEH